MYRSHVVGAGAAARIAAVARREGLETLALLGGEPRELDKSQARRLAKEASRLRVEASLLELDSDLTALAAVARWCARAAEASWLTLSDV